MQEISHDYHFKCIITYVNWFVKKNKRENNWNVNWTGSNKLYASLGITLFIPYSNMKYKKWATIKPVLRGHIWDKENMAL